ncbi:helix-turn-helix transcriptional regulator [Nonomuraea sp. NPDC059007]|uniref:helix-turn-helix transcriptional regulator n=1 Tax=Nonomuraea sp. NPDC059007 TaxID=3346692 RepID=UPI0036CB71FC
MRTTVVHRDDLGDDPVVRRALAAGAAIRVTEMTCLSDRRAYHPISRPTRPLVGLCLLRSGGFLMRRNGREEFIDPTVGFVWRDGDDTHIAHPADTCDVSSIVDLGVDLYGECLDWSAVAVLPVASQLDLQHRALVAACNAGTDQFEVTERVHGMLSLISAVRRRPGIGPRRAATWTIHRRLVAQVRAALIDGPVTASLDDLSRHVGVSPFHLSKVFRTVTGQTLARYRNELRVRAASEAIADGVPLRMVAHRFGFADQAHMTRTFRQQLGQTPTQVSVFLRAADGRPGVIETAKNLQRPAP